MRIEAIGSGYGYSNVRDIPMVSTEEVKRQDEQKLVSELSQQSVVANSLKMELNQAPKIGDLQEAADSLPKERDFEVIGRDSDLYKLDMEKAISDMKRDSILQDYQYFVRGAVGF